MLLLRQADRLVRAVLALAATQPGTSPNDEHWLETDLNWFSAGRRSAQPSSLGALRSALRRVKSYKGVVLNLGMTPNCIFECSGDPNQAIALRKGTGQELGARVVGPLLGATPSDSRPGASGFALTTTPPRGSASSGLTSTERGTASSRGVSHARAALLPSMLDSRPSATGPQAAVPNWWRSRTFATSCLPGNVSFADSACHKG
jgi:hypothetical protein